jgi:DNA polymerase III epsilon subunit-like protein
LFESRPGEVVVLDTETTGLHAGAEICQLAVVTLEGEVLLDTLIRPTQPIPWETTAIHRISDADVRGAPTYAELRGEVEALLQARGRTVVAYNAAFDERMVRQSALRHGLRPPRAAWECAMRQYARYLGQWDFRKNDYRWPRLPVVALPGIVPHTAVGDCRAVVHVLRRMAGLEDPAAEN